MLKSRCAGKLERVWKERDEDSYSSSWNCVFDFIGGSQSAPVQLHFSRCVYHVIRISGGWTSSALLDFTNFRTLTEFKIFHDKSSWSRRKEVTAKTRALDPERESHNFSYGWIASGRGGYSHHGHQFVAKYHDKRYSTSHPFSWMIKQNHFVSL